MDCRSATIFLFILNECQRTAKRQYEAMANVAKTLIESTDVTNQTNDLTNKLNECDKIIEQFDSQSNNEGHATLKIGDKVINANPNFYEPFYQAEFSSNALHKTANDTLVYALRSMIVKKGYHMPNTLQSRISFALATGVKSGADSLTEIDNWVLNNTQDSDLLIVDKKITPIVYCSTEIRKCPLCLL